MSIFKRISATVSANIENLIGEIENHEAVVDATIEEMQKKLAKAKVHLGQVNREQNKLQQSIHESQEKVLQWRQRAVDVARSGDEDKALMCVSRAKQSQQLVSQYEEALKQYQTVGKRLADDIKATEQKIQSVKQKKNLMRARESTSDALNSSRVKTVRDNEKQLEDTFERWEINVVSSELSNQDEVLDIADTLEDEFEQKEYEKGLKDELDALLNKAENKEQNNG
jgi:phage shock protein A